MDLYMIGIDLAKNVFQVHGVDREHKCVLRKQLNRREFIEFMAKLELCKVAMEACGGAYHWAREFRKMGHEVRLISPQFVKPFVKSNKNDANDAEAIVEAALRPSMRFVGIKTVVQQDMQFLHRIRERTVATRTACINEIRGIFREYGIALPEGVTALKKQFAVQLENPKISSVSKEVLVYLYEEVVRHLEKALSLEKKIKALAQESPICQKLLKINGVGILTASAVASAVADPKSFRNGRSFAAWVGLVPRHIGTGGKNVNLGLSKKGDRYLKSLFIHGGRAVLQMALKRDVPEYEKWRKLEARVGFNKATVAIANRNARVVWKLLTSDEEYKKNIE